MQITQREKDVLQNCFLFAGVSAADMHAIWDTMPTPDIFAKGETLRCNTALAIVLEGELRVYSAGNHRALLNTLSCGSVCGVTTLFSDDKRTVSEMTVTKDSVVLRIPQQTLSAWFATYPVLVENYIRFLTGRIRFLNQKIASYTGGQADARVWRYCQEHRMSDGSVQLSKSLSALAKTLDVGRSSLYRSLDTLEADGRIRREGKKIYIL